MSERLPLRLVGVGPQRTGSTWLDQQLRRHPDLAFPTHVKETFFFDRHWSRGLADYRAHFPRGATAWAEIGPTYFDHAEAPARIAEVAPEAAVVVTLRDPVDRAVSLWQHHLRKGRVSRDFWDAAESIPTILTAGDYAEHVSRWQAAFGQDRVLVLLTDDLRGGPQYTLDAITDHVSLPRLGVTADATERVNAASAPRFPLAAKLAARAVTTLRDARLHRVVEVGKKLGLARVYSGGSEAPPTLAPEDREKLAERYAPHVAFVDDLLGRPTGWLAPASV
ncbi:MAG: sulfotransferase [Bacteroidota bacterium]